ncbi:uncharacterized protein Triagg1_228 [Trichoderma aggressivum f. europaeum]|uniref:Uncharacterized protein n=1 Tax=Trichoderma aggressivum f. europaeum TaxID=173218 RepID=A0AAE1M789_9HYPO|nr:hypothetical protein Triagg1_228 [Trichoderma aggressivum f. europaeum]
MSETVSIEDLEVRRFVRELQQRNSPLRVDCTKAMISFHNDQKDTELKRVLKKHGYELLSMQKLVELLQDPHQIPIVPIDKDIETKPTVGLGFFTGAYLITSPPWPSVTEITQLVVEDYCISWVDGGSKKEFKPTVTVHTTVAFNGRKNSEYQVEWGDKGTEWFSARFSTQYDASTKKFKQMFLGFRNMKGGMQWPFGGIRTYDAN